MGRAALAGLADGYILIAKLFDYYRFIRHEQGNLRRYLFDSNVRDYLGENKVNLDIATSLDDETGPDFLWLNNGVTIPATNAVIRGGKNMMMQDIQVVNGLQTTESIYRHFHSGSRRSSDRAGLESAWDDQQGTVSLACADKIDLLNATRGVVAFPEEVVRRGCRV
jgi:AIPR protein